MSPKFREALGQKIHAEHHATLVVRALQQAEVAITEVRSDRPTQERSDPLPPLEAYGVGVQLRDFPVHEWWEDGRQAPVVALRAGEVTLYDRRRDPRFRINNPFHSIHFLLPRALFDALADESGTRRFVDLEYVPGHGIDDPVLTNLALALQPVFRRPERASPLFLESVALAVATHVAVTYGHMRGDRRHQRGGLAPWQRRRAVALMDAHLDGNVRTADLARECGLSSGHFTQAFKTSTGVTPHRWLLRRRVDKAMEVLWDPARTLSDIALSCGFADQSHFTRVFSALVGCPPGEWRRRNGVRA